MQTVLLIILLAHGGYWFGGVENTITVQWAAPEIAAPAATLTWQLGFGGVELAKGETQLAPGDAATTLKIQIPEVRTLTTLTWKYQLKDKTGKLLESGERPITACPAKMLTAQAKRAADKKIAVLDDSKDGIAAVLTDAAIDFTRLETLGDLQLRKIDLLIIGENQLTSDTDPDLLLAQARQGVTVLIFAQTNAKELAGFAIIKRAAKIPLTWDSKHLLFDHFPPAALDAWAANSDELSAIALPKDAPILALGAFPRETPGETPVPIDALVTTQTLDRGRIVCWQLPLANWKSDPRAHILAANALDYLQTRPEPTLPQSLRKPKLSPEIEKSVTNTITHTIVPGDKK